jgi:flagellar biogenesis protein FliO
VKQYRTPQAAPEPEEGGGLFLGVLGKLALVVALMFACAAGWKKLQSVVPQTTALAANGVQLLSTLPLGAQRCLHVVAVGRQQLLIASTPQSITLLSSLDEGVTDRSVSLPERSVAASGRATTTAREDSDWQGRAAPADDRFEELLRRLRRLEGEQVRRAPVAREDPADGRACDLTGGPSAGHLLAAGGRRSNGNAANREENGGAGSSLVPGALFRTADATRMERHA